MLMLKRIKLCLCGLVILAFLISANIASGDDADVAICTIVYPFGTDVEVVPTIEDAIQEVVVVQSYIPHRMNIGFVPFLTPKNGLF